MKINKVYILCLILGILSCFRIIRPGFFSVADEMHVFRLEQFHKCIVDFQIPCRYVPDAGFGYGYPLFNFYAPFFYTFAEIFHLIGFDFVTSIKIVLILTKLIGSFGMYFLTSSFLATSLFVFAPYQATNLFVRGAFPELLALNLIPWVFYFFKKKHYFYSTIFLAILLLTHSLTSISILIVLVPYLFFFIKDIKKQITSILGAFGLSAFFLLPSFFEKNLTTIQTMTQGYFQYINHFATLSQLFISRTWAYGASLWGPKDDMSFSVGLLQWLIPLISLFFIKKSKNKIQTIFLTIFALFFLFLTHNKSTFIWQMFPFMSFFQFPWRFLGIAIFLLSLISAQFKLNNWLTGLLVILIISLNIGYFKEDIWYQKYNLPIEKVSGEGLKDYWPNYGKNFPTQYLSDPLYTKKSNLVTATITIDDNKNIMLPVVYFPKMKLFVDSKEHSYSIEETYGQIITNLNPGVHELKLVFYDTFIRTLANYISLASLLFLLPYLWHLKKK